MSLCLAFPCEEHILRPDLGPSGAAPRAAGRSLCPVDLLNYLCAPVRHSVPRPVKGRSPSLASSPLVPAIQAITQHPSQLPTEVPPPALKLTERLPVTGSAERQRNRLLGRLRPPPPSWRRRAARCAGAAADHRKSATWVCLHAAARALTKCGLVPSSRARAGVNDALGAASTLGAFALAVSSAATFFSLTLSTSSISAVVFPLGFLALTCAPMSSGRCRGSLTQERRSREDPSGDSPILPP